VIDRNPPRPRYTEYDRALMRLIAARVGIAIDNARLYRRVERQNRTFKTLAHISREFSSILDLNELLSKLASTMRDLINYDAFSILLVDHDAKALRHLFSIRYDQRVNIDNVPLGKGITGAAVESREVVRVHDTAKDPRYIASHSDIRSEVAVPLSDRSGRDGPESDRVGYQRRSRALGAAGAPGGQQRGECPAIRRAARERCMEEDLEVPANCSGCCRRTRRWKSRGWSPPSGCGGARSFRRHLRHLRAEGPEDHHRHGRRQRQGHRGGPHGSLVSGLLRTAARGAASPRS
jgi:putative methionine-R-sulfoxide reductase with GAF domain